MCRNVRFTCALRIAAVLLLLWAVDSPPGSIAALGPPRIVVTRNPKVGIHTRLTDEPARWNIQRTLSMVREMGAPWIVEFFLAHVEPKGRV
jgi:hypothetical protein